MTNKKSIKRALLASVMAIVVCFSMLLGTTFAWFTDSAISGNNVITAGNLDIDVDYTLDGENWKDLDGATDLFQKGLWEPGHTEVVALRIMNNGSLALKYKANMKIVNENVGKNSAGEDIVLSDILTMSTLTQQCGENGDNAVKLAFAGEDGILYEKTSTVKEGTLLCDETQLNSGDAQYVIVKIDMAETVGDEANHNGVDVPSIEFAVNVLATQASYESDSFGDQYDSLAPFGTYMELEAGDDLLAAMASAKKNLPLTIKLNGNVEWPTDSHHGENDITPASSIMIDGNGYTITATGSGVTPLGDTEAPMTLQNVKIVDNSVSYNESAWEFTYLEIGGTTLTCNNVTFADEIQFGTKATFNNCSFESNEASVYAVWVESGSAVFNNCTFTGYRGLKMHEDYGTEISSVIVKNCTFSDISKKPGIAIGTLNADTTVSVTGSTFINCQAGDQGLYLYETDTDLTTINFVEENNKVISGNQVAEGLFYDNANKTFTIDSKAGLMNLNKELAKVSPNEANAQKVNLLCDVDLAGEKWAPIESMWVTFNGNDHTISNVNAGFDTTGRRSGFWAYAGAVTINDLTLNNVTVAGSQAGTFAGSAEGLKINNCFLTGSNTVTYVDSIEDWNGIGAITGVLTDSNINVTIAEGATVQLIKEGFVTDAGCTFQNNLTGYIQANKGTIENNGTVKVVDLTIATADELFAFAKDVNENGNNYTGKTVALVADIDLEDKTWTPIGQTGATEFKGVFDGQGYTIKNLNVDSSAQTDKHYSSGLFGWIKSSNHVTVKNVNVDGATIVGHHNVAVIVGYLEGNAVIDNCNVTNATLKNTHENGDACGDKTGLIAGYAAGEVIIKNCAVSNSAITSGRDAGQLIGASYAVPTNCSATNVTVSAAGDCNDANINNDLVGRKLS